MADPATSLTATQGGFDTAALLQAIFTPQVPYSEWAARRRDGAELDTSKIEDAIRWAEAGIMFPVGDMIRETLALNPAATSFLGRAFTPIAMADWDVTQAEGDGLDEADAKRIANDVRAMLRGIRGFRQAIMHLAWGFSDGRAALEKEMVRTTSARPVGVSTRTVVTRLNRIEPQRLSFDDARRLIVVNRWGNSGRFIKQGPALDDIPGKFIQIMPSVFGDLQEREGLAIRFLFWLLFDRFQWRHRLQVMEKMGGPIGVLEQELANTMGAMKLPRDLGGEGGSPGDDAKSLDAALVAARAAMDRFGIFIGRPGEKFRFDWPPPEAHSLFSEGSDQILRHLEMLALHAALSSASTEQTRAGLVVLRTDQEILLDFRGALVAEAIQKDLVEPFVEMNYGPDALVYAPMFQLRTTPIRDRGAEVDRILKTAAAVPVGAGVLYEASGARPPNPGEPVIKPPAPSGPFGEGGAPGSGAAPAMPEEQSNDGQDAIGALRDLGEEADVDDQTAAADEEAGQVGAHLARWFADPGRKVMPATVHGSPEALVEAGTREGVRSTSQWADELVDAATGDDPARIYRNLVARAQTLNVEPFTRALERRLVHTLMLGALDADHEAVNDVEIKPATFDRLAFDGGVRDFTTLPFQEAIKAFSEKKVMSKRQFERLAADAKKKAFTVAGLTTKRMLETAHDELGKAITAGADLRDFSKKLNERFDAAGWTRLNPSHVENVFRTNVMGAYGDGRRAQMTQPHVMAARPYWQILGVDDARTRPAHRDAHGKVLPANDPFFERAGPPFSYNCRCRIISRSKRDLDRLGLTPTFGAAIRGLPEPGWNAAAITPPASWEVQDGPAPKAVKPPAVLPPKDINASEFEELAKRSRLTQFTSLTAAQENVNPVFVARLGDVPVYVKPGHANLDVAEAVARHRAATTAARDMGIEGMMLPATLVQSKAALDEAARALPALLDPANAATSAMFVTAAAPVGAIPAYAQSPQALAKVSEEDRLAAAALDFLHANADRHDGNALVSPDGRVFLIDHDAMASGDDPASIFFPGGALGYAGRQRGFADLPPKLRAHVARIAKADATTIAQEFSMSNKAAAAMKARAQSIIEGGLDAALATHKGRWLDRKGSVEE